MSKPNKIEKLEPTGVGGPDSMLNICGKKSSKPIPTTKPDFSSIGSSETLAKVKNFLPQMRQADELLKQKMQDGKDVNIENVDEQSNYIEMNVGLYEQKKKDGEDNWSIDSEPDSPGSPPERDNAYTSDSDSSSTGGSRI